MVGAIATVMVNAVNYTFQMLSAQQIGRGPSIFSDGNHYGSAMKDQYQAISDQSKKL
jgi:hypothetical protein